MSKEKADAIFNAWAMAIAIADALWIYEGENGGYQKARDLADALWEEYEAETNKISEQTIDE